MKFSGRMRLNIKDVIILNVTKKQGFISLEKLFSEKPQGWGSN